MRIGIDGRFVDDHYPGIGRYTYSLVRALGSIATNERFFVYLTGHQQNSRFPVEQLPAPSVWLRRVRTPGRTLQEQLAWRKWVAADGLDAVFSPYYVKPYVLQEPSIVALHDVIGLMGPSYLPSKRSRALLYLLTRLTIASSTRIITSSEASRREVLKRFPQAAGKIDVVPDAAGPPPTEAGEPGVEGPYLLYVGTNKPHKNLPRLIRAFARAKTSARLVLAGRQDPRFPEVASAIRELRLEDRVLVLGEVPEARLEGLFRNALAIVAPSLAEGFGLPALEAMIRGCPVLCSNQSSLPEVGGDAVLYFDPRDEASITQAIERIVDDGALRRDLAERGRRRAGTCFSWERTAQCTLDVIHWAVEEW